MRRYNGWTYQAKRKSGSFTLDPIIENRPPKFETVLQSLGLPRDQAIYDVRLRGWVKKHYRNYFVPEDILGALGLSTHESNFGDTVFLKSLRRARGSNTAIQQESL